MQRQLAFLYGIAVIVNASWGQDQSLEGVPSFPIKLEAEEVREVPELDMTLNGFHIESGPVLLVAISCEKGVTGAVVIGQGKFKYAPEGAEAIEGQFRSAMLRFNPNDKDSLLPPGGSVKVTDAGAVELSRHLLRTAFGRCWHRGPEALIPPTGTLTADLYSKEHGELLVATDKKSATVYNFTSNKKLFEKK